MVSKRIIRDENRKLRHELEVIYGSDWHDEGTVVRWFKAYDSPDNVYTYIGLKTGPATWHVNGEYRSWGDILLDVDKDNILEHGNLIEVATKWEEITNEPPF